MFGCGFIMNERITLLALQASDPKTGWLDRQKFAELIVRECGRVYIQNQQDGVMTLTQDLSHHLGIKK